MSQNQSFNSFSEPLGRDGFSTVTKDSFVHSSATDNDPDDLNGQDDAIELDQRAFSVKIEHVYVDMDATEAHAITEIALGVYNTCVLLPTRNTWRNEEGARRELERDVERTTMGEMSRQIKSTVQEKMGGSWHVIEADPRVCACTPVIVYTMVYAYHDATVKWRFLGICSV